MFFQQALKDGKFYKIKLTYLAFYFENKMECKNRNISPLTTCYNNWKNLSTKEEVKANIKVLIERMSSYEIVIFTTVWYKLLKCIYIRDKILQSPKLCLPDTTDSTEGPANW